MSVAVDELVEEDSMGRFGFDYTGFDNSARPVGPDCMVVAVEAGFRSAPRADLVAAQEEAEGTTGRCKYMCGMETGQEQKPAFERLGHHAN